jgi:hypothetical protein
VAHLRKVGSLLLVLAKALACATRINEVDFRTFNYAWDASITAPVTWKWLEGKPSSTLRVTEGRHDFSPDGYVLVRSVTYGDLDGDGRDEVAVDLLFGTGGTANWHYLYVFTLLNGSPTLLGRLQSGSRADGGLVKVAIEHNTLLLDFADTRRRVADCCSEGYVRVTYRWRSGRFVEVGTRVSGDLDIGK